MFTIKTSSSSTEISKTLVLGNAHQVPWPMHLVRLGSINLKFQGMFCKILLYPLVSPSGPQKRSLSRDLWDITSRCSSTSGSLTLYHFCLLLLLDSLKSSSPSLWALPQPALQAGIQPAATCLLAPFFSPQTRRNTQGFSHSLGHAWIHPRTSAAIPH